MSHSFIDPKKNYYNVDNDSDTPQQKIDPVAQLKWLNTPQVHGEWGLFRNEPANNETMQMSAEEEIQRKDEEDTEIAELSDTGHGVTNTTAKLTYTIKNGKSIKKSKVIEIPTEKALIIKGETSGENITVSVEIDGVNYEGVMLKSNVNITPNSLDEIDSENKKI